MVLFQNGNVGAFGDPMRKQGTSWEELEELQMKTCISAEFAARRTCCGQLRNVSHSTMICIHSS